MYFSYFLTRAAFIVQREVLTIRYFLFSDISLITVANASVILAFRISTSGTGRLNILPLACPHYKKRKKIQKGISGEHDDYGVGPSLPIPHFGNSTFRN